MTKQGSEDSAPSDLGSDGVSRAVAPSDLLGLMALGVFALLLLVGALVLVYSKDADNATDTAAALAGSSVVMPADSELFGSPVAAEATDTTTSECGVGRIDLLTADESTINLVRGLRQTRVAALVAANRGLLVETADLVRIGISDALVSRILLSREVCIGAVAPDDDLPTAECAAGDLDINTAFLSELSEIQGLDAEQIQVLYDNRPYADVHQIVSTEGIAERTITWLALNQTCLRQIVVPVADVSPDCSTRVDLNTATVDEISQVRGLHRSEDASLVAANQGSLASVGDLLELGLDPGRVGRTLKFRQACFGDTPVDVALPDSTCAETSLNLNTASIVELLDLEGISHNVADLLMVYRPFATPEEIFDVPGLPDNAITWLALADTCLGDDQHTLGTCGVGRIDLRSTSIEQLIQTAGMRDENVARLVFENRADLESFVDLLELGLSENAVGKVLASRQACFGDRFPEHDLPGQHCGPLDLDLNTANVAELIGLAGISHRAADRIIYHRPYSEPADLILVRTFEPRTISALAALDTCVKAPEPDPDAAAEPHVIDPAHLDVGLTG